MGAYPCSGTGIEWTVEQAEKALEGKVMEIAYELVGLVRLESIYGRLAGVDSARNRMRDLLRERGAIEPWRAGEAVARTYLTAHRDCVFFWPVGRGMRVNDSILPGPDHMGLRKDDIGYRFVFCEVKTSADRRRPPRVTNKQGGLIDQLKRLSGDDETRARLVDYIVSGTDGEEIRHDVRSAFEHYDQDHSDVNVFGFLVRDVVPDERDLVGCVVSMRNEIYSTTMIEVIALYLPLGMIEGMGETLFKSVMGRYK